MSTSSPPKYPSTKYTPRETTYSPSDFDRQDPSTDSTFYSTPRFVTHIDDHAISTLTGYYTTQIFQPLLNTSQPNPTDLPNGHRPLRILDLCTSHLTHYPPSLLSTASPSKAKVIGLGMNLAELTANPLLTTRVLADLNSNPNVGAALQLDPTREQDRLDVATCVVSIDYLIHPVEVLESLRRVTRVGGIVHLVISNRCFPTKAIRRWLMVGEEERLRMVGDFLWRAGWRDVEILVLSDGKSGQDEDAAGAREGWLKALMGMGGRDPLWVVRGRNVEG